MTGLPEKRSVTVISLLSYDLIFKILLLLPAKDLLRLSFVCKTWHRLINSPNFIQAHTHRCETVLTFLNSFSEARPDTFDINSKNGRFALFEPPLSKKWKRQIHFMEFQARKARITNPNVCGFDEILATCDGLVLATNNTKSLVILNPTTRKILRLKSGTIVPRREESYGFLFNIHAREYNAVHVFRDNSGHTDGEILSLATKSWRGCSEVPSFGLFKDFTHKPVSASGVLYWLPGGHNIDYFVSMELENKKFVRKALPVKSTGRNDRLVENGGFLNFVAQMTVYRIQLWTLKRNEFGDDWLKHYMINLDYNLTGFVPLVMTKKGRCLIFKQAKNSIYEYDMEGEEMERVMVDGDSNIDYKMVFPHMNTLSWWANSGPMW